jgi:hypothetical protein
VKLTQPDICAMPKRDGARSGNVPGSGGALLPEQDGAADQQHRQDPGQQHQRQTEPGGDHAELQTAVAEHLHRVQRDTVLEGGMGEKLDRLDIGDRVDDLTRDHGARRGAGSGILADHRQEETDQEDIGDQPDQQRDRRLGIDGQQEGDRTDDRGERETDGVDHLGRDIGDGAGGLHLLLRDATGEVIVEESYGLAEGPAVQARQDQGHHVRADDDAVRGGRDGEGQGAQDQVEAKEPEDQVPVPGEEIGRPGTDGGVDHPAKDQGRDDLGDAGQRRQHASHDQHEPGTRKAPADEGPQLLRRIALGRAEGVDEGAEALKGTHEGEVGLWAGEARVKEGRRA